MDFFSRRNLTFGKDFFASKAIAYKLEVALQEVALIGSRLPS